MKKKRIVIAVIILILAVAAAAYIVARILNRGTDIIGVTTLEKTNTVIMNSASGDEFVSGSGKITVAEGQSLQLEYKLSAGSFDIGFDPGTDPVLEAAENQELESMTGDPLEAPAGYQIEKDGIEGSGKLTFEAQPGEYQVHFIMHGAVGNAKVTTGKAS